MKFGNLIRNDLRYHCFVIGYMNLLAGVVDIACHLLIVCIATNGFQCDTTAESLRAVNWPWLEPILLVINIGTHGFYPFPMNLKLHNFADTPVVAREATCYPGMVHVYLIDVLNFTINVIWLNFVISYVRAVHKKNPEPMRVFFALSLVKLVIQVMYFAYQPDLYGGPWPRDSNWFIKIIDICTATVFILIINKYIRVLNQEMSSKIVEQPPSYIECLMAATKSEPNANENSDQVAIIVVRSEEHEIGEVKKDTKITKE